MKKKILIVTHFMEIGGAERALLGLLDAMDYDQYDVSLFLFRHEGALYNMIPKEVNILPEIPAYTALARPIGKVIRQGHLLLAVSRAVGKYMAKIYDRVHHLKNSQVDLEYSHKYTRWLMPKITPETEYDLAISFLTPHYFVAEKVRAKKKIAWIHTDYATIAINRKSELKMWDQYDHIVAISEAVRQSFITCFPPLQDKVVMMENILPARLIKKQAEEEIDDMPEDHQSIRLLSIGRFTEAKNFDNVPDICSRILNKGINVIWYLIGYGGDEDLIRKNIKQSHMEDHVVILGKKVNPYPYMKRCDWYVQPSRYEGKSVSVCEAQLLHKPVIITDYPTANSQVVNGVDGIIVPLDKEKCAEGIAKAIRDDELRKKLISNTYKKDYSNKSEINKLYTMMKD